MRKFPRLNVIKDRRGTAAVEFALIFGLFLLPLFIGIIEVTTLYRAQNKLNAFVNDVANLVAIQAPGTSTTYVYQVPATGISGPSLQDACNGAAAGMAPYPANGIKLQIASVTMEASNKGLSKASSTSASVSANSATSFVYTSAGTPIYNQWEQDFVVSGGSCSAVTTTGIGASGAGSAAINLVSTSPPSTTAGGCANTASLTGTGCGIVQFPCDNGIIVKAQMAYPGLLGLIITKAMTLSQSAYVRWVYASTVSELQCPTCTVSTAATTASWYTTPNGVAITQACNSTNATAVN